MSYLFLDNVSEMECDKHDECNEYDKEADHPEVPMEDGENSSGF